MKLNRIPHIYHDTKYVRNIFEIFKEKHENIRQLYLLMNNFHNINESSGILLDLKGQNIGVPRAGRTDNEYRKILIFEYLQLVKIGNLDDMKTILELYFNIEVDIKELSGKIIVITKVDNKEELYEKISALKAAGVGFIVTDDEYIEDYTIKELEDLTLEKINTIKIAKR